MNARTGLWIALAAGINVGCAPMTPTVTASPAPRVAIAACGVAVAKSKCTTNICTVVVTMSGTGPSAVPMLNPNELVIDNPGAVDIVWELPAGAQFVAAKGDGIFIPGPDKDQFAFNYPTQRKNGFPGNGRKGQYYHWNFDNSNTDKYKYILRFRIGSDAYECDPLINNEAGGG